jgi:hypothetical protein
MASHASVPRDFVELIASQMAEGIESALQHWLSRVDDALHDYSLTTLGRMHAVEDILNESRQTLGNPQVEADA